MSLVKLEQFNTLTAVAQGREIKDLVKSEQAWLGEAQPGTVKRYKNTINAARNVYRLATSAALEAYIVRRDTVAVGLATVIFNQRVIHPTAGLFEGDDIDYWLKFGTDRPTHVSAASLLIDQRLGKYSADNREKTFTGLEDLKQYKAMASIIDKHPNPAVGFTDTMKAVGGPAILSTDIPGDPYGMARGGKPTHLYSYQAVDI